MRNCNDCWLSEILPYCLLNVTICLAIDGGRGLIKNDDLRASQPSTSQTHQLPLTNGQIGTTCENANEIISWFIWRLICFYKNIHVWLIDLVITNSRTNHQWYPSAMKMRFCWDSFVEGQTTNPHLNGLLLGRGSFEDSLETERDPEGLWLGESVDHADPHCNINNHSLDEQNISIIEMIKHVVSPMAISPHFIISRSSWETFRTSKRWMFSLIPQYFDFLPWNVNAIDNNASFGGLKSSEQRQTKWTLASSGATHDAHLHPSCHFKFDILQHFSLPLSDVFFQSKIKQSTNWIVSSLIFLNYLFALMNTNWDEADMIICITCM